MPALLAAALIGCLVVWSDTFPVDAPNRALYQDVKVELCERYVEVSARVWQEVATPAGTEEYELSGWNAITREWIKPAAEKEEAHP